MNERFKKTVRAFFCLGGIMLFLFGCSRDSKYQDRGADFLQGSWAQKEVRYQDQLVSYTLHDFRFTCDSVYVTLHQHSKAQTVPEPCFNDGHWKEYAQGVYVVRNDSLLIEATYTHEDWKQKISGCYTIGQYLARFKIARQTADSLYLEDRNSLLPIALQKTATTRCDPKVVY